MTAVSSGVWLPLFDELSDPLAVVRLAAEAEAAGWDGFFLWDQLRWEAPVREVADSWITLAAVAAATERLRLGPMVTPLPRRRPVKVARETATLDQLSGGRLTLGVGIGEDRFAREFSKTSEQLDDRARGQMLDEALKILTTAWSGEPVHHHGDHYTVDDIQFLPRPARCGWQPSAVPPLIAAVPSEERARTQGVVDMTMGIAGDAGGTVSGIVVGSVGYASLSLMGALVAGAVLVLFMQREPSATQLDTNDDGADVMRVDEPAAIRASRSPTIKEVNRKWPHSR